MKMFSEQKTRLNYCAALFLLFGFIFLVCGTLFENEKSELSKHQETMYRQDQVHYWAGIPFIALVIVSVLFLVLENTFLLKFCIGLDFICINIAIFVIIVEGPDWKKYQAKSNHYYSSGHVDYEMIKPQQDYGSYSPLGKSYYDNAMYYSGAWVFVAICSILLGVETFLMHIKVYCGIESIYAYISGYELVHPEITLKTAKPIEKFLCKGCQTKPPTPTQSPSPTKAKRPVQLHSPPTVIRAPIQQSAPDSVTDGKPNSCVSPTPSDASNASNAFYVCQEADGIKLVGYKPRRRGLDEPHLCTHHEEEEGQTDHYHFSRKHPSEIENSQGSITEDSRASPSIPTPPPLPPLVSGGKHPSPTNDLHNSVPVQFSEDIRVSPSIPKPLPLSLTDAQSANADNGMRDRSPGKYPLIGDIFPPLPSVLPREAHGREKGKVSFQDRSTEISTTSSRPKRNSKLDTLF